MMDYDEMISYDDENITMMDYDEMMYYDDKNIIDFEKVIKKSWIMDLVSQED